MEEDKVILEGCEIGCIPIESGLIACPLSKEEASKCSRRLGYLVGIKEVGEWLERKLREVYNQPFTQVYKDEIKALKRGEMPEGVK